MGTRFGYVAGAFDTFDVEHLTTLRHAGTHCDVPTVVATDVLRLPRTARGLSASLWCAVDAISVNSPVVVR